MAKKLAAAIRDVSATEPECQGVLADARTAHRPRSDPDSRRTAKAIDAIRNAFREARIMPMTTSGA
jgi:hypothetical protein